MVNRRFYKRNIFLGIALSCSLILGGTLFTGFSNESTIKDEPLNKEEALKEVKPMLEKYIMALNDNNNDQKRKYTTEKFLEDKRNVLFETGYENANYNKKIENVTIDEIISNTEVISFVEYGNDDWNSIGLIKEDKEWKVESVDFDTRKTDSIKYTNDDLERDSKVARDEMHKFLEGKYTIAINSGMTGAIRLPNSFKDTKGGVEVGKIIKGINDISTEDGLNFKDYLGENVYLYCVSLEDGKGEAVVLVSEGKVIGKAVIPTDGKEDSISILIAKLNIEVQ